MGKTPFQVCDLRLALKTGPQNGVHSSVRLSLQSLQRHREEEEKRKKVMSQNQLLPDSTKMQPQQENLLTSSFP